MTLPVCEDRVFRENIRAYNNLVRNLEESEGIELSICANNCVFNPVYFYGQRVNFFNHPALNACYYQNASYVACLTFKDIGRHVCSIFPICLGSDLDTQFRHLLQNKPCCASEVEPRKRCTCTETNVHHPLFGDSQIQHHRLDVANVFDRTRFFLPDDDTSANDHNLYSEQYLPLTFGYYVIGGRFVILPFIMTNNRNMIHESSEQVIDKRSVSADGTRDNHKESGPVSLSTYSNNRYKQSVAITSSEDRAYNRQQIQLRKATKMYYSDSASTDSAVSRSKRKRVLGENDEGRTEYDDHDVDVTERSDGTTTTQETATKSRKRKRLFTIYNSKSASVWSLTST